MLTLRHTLTLLIFLLSLGGPYAQLTPAEAVAGMGRGINLGNTLEPPTEGAWNNGPAEEKYFDAYVDAGFTNVRVPVRWDEHTQKIAPYTIDAEWLDRVEEVLDWGLDRGLYITINSHHDDWIKVNYKDATQRARFAAIWAQVAERFKDKSEKLLFEVINEPLGLSQVQIDELNQNTLDIIRLTNPTRLVVYGGNVYSNSAELLAVRVLDDDYTIAYFHSYDPFQFGLEGQGSWGTIGDIQQLDRKFASVAKWSADNKVPVYLSEFGAVLQADYNSRMRFYAAFTETAVRYGFAFSAWDDGGMFRILDRDDNTWPVVKDVLINTYSESPTDLTAITDDPVDSSNIEVVLEWVNRSTQGAITLERATGQGEFSSIATLAAGTTTYKDADEALAVGNFYLYRLAITRADDSLVQSYPLRVLLAGEQTPYGDTAIDITDTLQAENFDRGGEGVAYHDSEEDNIPQQYRPDEGVDIDDNGRGGFAVGYLARGEWLEYTVNVPTAGPFSVSSTLASAVGGGTMKISTDEGASSVSISVSGEGTGGYGTFAPFTSKGNLFLEAGEQIIRVDITGNAPFNFDYLVFTAGMLDTSGRVNYSDGLDTATTAFTGTPNGITYILADGVLTVVGDGTGTPYQTFRYELPDTLLANALASGSKLYVRARTTSGRAMNLRADLIDDNEFATTLVGLTKVVSGTDFKTYPYDFTGTYKDAGYGGTGCTEGTPENPCDVNGARIKYIAFYPEPDNGKFNDTLQIDYLSFGVSLDTVAADTTPTGIINYQEDFTGSAAALSNVPAGITYDVADGYLTIRGNGTSEQYQTIVYSAQSDTAATPLIDVAGSKNLLFLRARSLRADTVDLRIDLADGLNRQTSLAGTTVRVIGAEFATYSIDYTDKYVDAGYGGTGCSAVDKPCPVDSLRVSRLIIYPEPFDAKFNDTLQIDWIAFGVALTTAVRDFAQLDGLSLYPNPVSDRLNLRFELNTATEVRVDLFDASGRTIRRQVYGRQAVGTTTLPFATDGLSAGTYFIQIHIGGIRTAAYPVQIR